MKKLKKCVWKMTPPWFCLEKERNDMNNNDDENENSSSNDGNHDMTPWRKM